MNAIESPGIEQIILMQFFSYARIQYFSDIHKVRFNTIGAGYTQIMKKILSLPIYWPDVALI